MTLREILERANTTCRRLGREEDGVVLSVVMVTLMSLYLMGAATFAVGEHIRDRIEIQNAVDAAAYSAAIVQADTLSRIAAINQAMAWTYIQMVKRHMDYITGIWLDKVLYDYRLAKFYLEWHHGIYHHLDDPDDYEPISLIKINGGDDYSYDQVENDLDVIDWQSLTNDINADQVMLNNMGAAQKDLIDSMTNRMQTAAWEVLKQNLGANAEDEFRFAFVFGVPGADPNTSQIFDSYDNHTETLFLKCVNPNSSAISVDDNPPAENNLSSAQVLTRNIEAALFDDGAHDGQWFVKPGEGIGRQYVEQNSYLQAEWTGENSGYKYSSQQHYGYTNVATNIFASSVKDVYFDTKPITPSPQRLNKPFFMGGGSIVVAVSRPLRNPFALFVSSGGAGGLYGAFAENGRMMTAVAAARAGYKDIGRDMPGTGEEKGAYNPFDDSYEIDPEGEKRNKGKNLWTTNGWTKLSRNLSVTDWDATLIPLKRAWTGKAKSSWQNRSGAEWNQSNGYGESDNPYESGQWTSDSSVAVLNHLLTAAPWQDLKTGDATPMNLAGQIQRPAPQPPNKPPPPLVLTGFGDEAAELGRSLYH